MGEQKCHHYFGKICKSRLSAILINVKYVERAKTHLIRNATFLKSYVVGVPFKRSATDIAGPFPVTENRNRYILVVGDYFPKLTEAYAIPDIQAISVADIISVLGLNDTDAR